MKEQVNANDGIDKVLISEAEIAEKVAELGAQISRDFAGKNLLLVGVLKGSILFMADLLRHITIPCGIEFMAVSSYGAGTSTTGVVRIIKDLSIPIDDYDVLVVEDILDSGVTLSYLLELLKGKNAKSVSLITLLDKPERRKKDVRVDYKGFTVPDEFVVGYGLDYDEKYRNLPYIGVLKPEVYSE